MDLRERPIRLIRVHIQAAEMFSASSKNFNSNSGFQSVL
jgi:hypothetical protein